MDVQEANHRVANVVFGQLGSFAHIMISLKVEPIYAGELVSKYACKYNLSTEDMNTLSSLIDKTSGRAESVTV